MTRVLAAWGSEAPDWIVALAKACDAASQGHVARELDISAPRVNQALGRKYEGRMDRLEQLVRGQYMKATVTCPVLGEISTRDCQENQLRNKTFRATNPLRVALRRACPACPNREREDGKPEC
jgi:hypothetical protein